MAKTKTAPKKEERRKLFREAATIKSPEAKLQNDL